MIWDTYNLYGGYYIYTIDNNGNTVPVGTSLTLQESGSIYCYDGTFYAIKVETNDSDGNSCILTTYTISYITSTNNSVTAQALLNTSLDSNIQTIEGSLSSI
ncbi:MAG: hypothetical protein LUC37_00335 [Prevotella sp.]|nr:hypothetical protein [Prevotella sp.]